MDRTRTEFAFEAVATDAAATSAEDDLRRSPEDDLCGSPDPTGSRAAPSDPGDARARVARLSRVLRGIGALVVAASAGTFLFQRWEQGSDLGRYFALLAQTGLLSAAGFFCAVRLAESRSARTFQALAVGMIPALFAILGGLVYSQWSLDGEFTQIASYATWVAPTGFSALATVAATLVVAVPVALLALLSLARSEARVLTTAFVTANAALLIPTRSPAAMAGLVAAGFGSLAWLELRRFRNSTAMQTREGLVARAMLALPFVLIVARSLVHYELSLYMGSILAFALAGALFAVGRGQGSAVTAVPFEIGGLVPLAVGWMAFAGATVETTQAHDGAFLPLAALPFALSTQALAFIVRRENAPILRTFGVVIALLAMGANLWIGHGVVPAFLALVTGIGGVVHGFLFERRSVMVLGALVGGTALIGHVVEAARLYAHFNWTSLTVLGVAVIFGASMLERHHVAISKWAGELRTRLRGEELA